MRHGKYPLLAAFLLTALVLYGYFVVSPYAQAFYISMTDWHGLSNEYNWVGLSNFKRLLSDEYMLNALWHNALLLILLPVITIALGLFFSSMLNVHRARGAGLYKIIYFAPQVLSVAVIGVLWKEIYNPRSGLLNGTLRAVGLVGLAKTWLGDPAVAFWALLAVMIWANVGFYVVLFGAAMQSIPKELYEAAELDGSSRWSTLWRITLPLLW